MLRYVENLCAKRETPEIMRGYTKKNIASQVILKVGIYGYYRAEFRRVLLYTKSVLQGGF